MANHQRRRPKNQRAGCLLCKPSKANGVSPVDRLLPRDLRKLGRVRRLTRHDLGADISE